MKGENETGGPSLSQLVWHFVGHVTLGTVGFVALAIPAVLLSIGAHYLALIPVSPFVVEVLLWVHDSLLAVDTLMFAAYILVSIYGAAKELIRYAKGL